VAGALFLHTPRFSRQRDITFSNASPVLMSRWREKRRVSQKRNTKNKKINTGDALLHSGQSGEHPTDTLSV